ncbi:MAG: hypothetical protein FWC46_05900 [Actinomycetia bacterium]|nr:hypothetical protein [Actinomycetes bacterium]
MAEQVDGGGVTPVAAIRARPRMYVGDAGPEALWRLVRIVLDYCVGTDGPIPSGSQHVRIALLSDGGLDISGDGCGLPAGPSGHDGREDEPWLTLAFTSLWGGRVFPGSGLAIVNALSHLLIASVDQGNDTWTVRFEDGEQDGPLSHGTMIGAHPARGTSIVFWPRPEIVGGGFDRAAFDAHLEAYIAGHAGVAFSVTDYDTGAFDAATSGATRAVIRMVGGAVNAVSTELVVLDLRVRAAVDDLRGLLAVEAVIDGYCMCSGQLAVEFLDEAGGRLAYATIHHGAHLRWSGWSGDGMLADGPALAAWLVAHGVPDPETLRRDETRYSVFLDQSDVPDAGLLQRVHRHLAIGIQEARRLIRAGDVLYRQGQAVEVYATRRELDEAGHAYHIAPEFPYPAGRPAVRESYQQSPAKAPRRTVA